MRKIEQEMIGAVSQLLGKPNQYKRVGSNTEVSTNNNGAVSIDLHGNQIASVTWSASGQCFLFSIYANGYLWHSRTTFSRVNALACHLIGGAVLYSKRGEKMLARKRTNKQRATGYGIKSITTHGASTNGKRSKPTNRPQLGVFFYAY